MEQITQHEQSLIDRSNALLKAADSERDHELRATLLVRCQQLQMQAVFLQMARKMTALAATGQATQVA